MIGYAIGSRYWGRGIAAEAARAVMEWGYREHGLKRIWASTHLENERSKRVLCKLGFRLWKVEQEAFYEMERGEARRTLGHRRAELRPFPLELFYRSTRQI